MTVRMPKISVVIPVYNAERFLRQTLDSVLCQSMKEIEVICVDDGSTDNSIEILREYEGKDERIKVLQQENLHAGIARNAGLALATGEYIHFLDADDYVVDFAYEALYHKVVKYDLDCVKFPSAVYDMAQDCIVEQPYYSFSRLKREDFDRLLTLDARSPMHKVSVAPWSGIYRRDFLEKRQIRFSDLFCVNDHSFFIKVITNAKRMMITRDSLVVHRVNIPDSLVGVRIQHFECHFRNIEIVNQQLIDDQVADEIRLPIMKREFGDLFLWCRKFYSDPIYGEEICSETKRFVERYRGLYSELLQNMYRDALYPMSVSEIIPCRVSEPVKVSAVIPVYNAEKYLKECLDSLLAQTMADFEIICVDDGSTDASLEILKQYAEKDMRIRLLSQENFYAGAARNNGLAAALGEYVIFLDADDCFDSELLEKVCQKADENTADIVLFGGRRLDDRSGKIAEKREFLKADLLPAKPFFSAKDIPDEIFRVTNPAPWTKLYRRGFLLSTGIHFQTLQNSNDVFFTFATLAVAERISAVDADLIFYRVNTGSSLQNKKSAHPLCFMESIYALFQFLVKCGRYNALRQSFRYISLSMTKYNLTTVGTDQARLRILEEMMSSRFRALDFLRANESSYYATPAELSYAQFLSAALKFRGGHNRRVNQSKTLKIISGNPAAHIKVSVVIPVYNTEMYLDETLSSVTRQTLSEIEIICINDGSTDQSLAVLLEWAEKDSRISVFSQRNSGPAHSRNNGLLAAKGEYVYFLDSDDYLDEDALEQLYKRAKKDELDVLYFDAESFYDCSEAIAEENKSFRGLYIRKGEYPEVCDGPMLYEKMEENTEYRDSIPLQFLRRDFLNEHHIRCPAGILHEDNAFSFSVILRAKRAAHLSRALYHRRIRANSIMTTSVSFQTSYGYFYAFLAMWDIFSHLRNQLRPEVRSAAAKRISLKLYMAQNSYAQIPDSEVGSEYGLAEDFHLFMKLVKEPVELKKAKAVSSAKLRSVQANLKKTYAQKSDLDAKLQYANKEKTDLIRKLKQAELEKKKLATDKARLLHSRSYRLGRFLSAPYRWLKKKVRG